jgi:hypothetical protein
MPEWVSFESPPTNWLDCLLMYLCDTVGMLPIGVTRDTPPDPLPNPDEYPDVIPEPSPDPIPEPSPEPAPNPAPPKALELAPPIVWPMVREPPNIPDEVPPICAQATHGPPTAATRTATMVNGSLRISRTLSIQVSLSSLSYRNKGGPPIPSGFGRCYAQPLRWVRGRSRNDKSLRTKALRNSLRSVSH